jgi:hypothetical protein
MEYSELRKISPYSFSFPTCKYKWALIPYNANIHILDNLQIQSTIWPFCN